MLVEGEPTYFTRSDATSCLLQRLGSVNFVGLFGCQIIIGKDLRLLILIIINLVELDELRLLVVGGL